MLTKEKIKEAIKDLPEEFSVDQLFDRIIVLSKVERGLEESASGKIYSTKEAKEKLSKWLK